MSEILDDVSIEDEAPVVRTRAVKPKAPAKRARVEREEPEYVDLLLASDDKEDYEVIQLTDSEEIPPPGQGFGVNGRQFLLRPNVWYRVPSWLLSTIDNCIVERPIRDEYNRLVGFRPMKRFPYETFRG
jgi:hypothetical protein